MRFSAEGDEVPVRMALEADLVGVVDLLRALHAETAYAPWSERRVVEAVHEAHREGMVFLSLAPDGRPVGTLGVALDRPWFSDQVWARDIWLFVDPAHRVAPHARTLLRTARRFAERVGVPLVVEVAGGSKGMRVPAKIRLYRRELGEPTGATWLLGNG